MYQDNGGSAPHPGVRDASCLMDERHPVAELRSEDCHERARAALDAATNATAEDVTRECLRLAMEWLRLAAEIRQVRNE